MSNPEITPPASVQVKEGPHGRGVYATQDIRKGETIEVCPALEVDEDDAGGLLGDYVLHSSRDPQNVVLLLGYGSLYNHSFDPSAEYVEEYEDALTFTALRDIPAGEEITIDYGPKWWEERELEPG